MPPAPAGSAYWLRADDGIRLRMAAWRQGARGTVLLFNGRTEYIEKFGVAVGEFRQRGFAFATLDWRGQGLSENTCASSSLCHIDDCREFQLDARAARQALTELGLPEPVYLVAHSMGGCIGLRSLHEGIPVRAAAFLAPLWGLNLGPVPRRLARILTAAAVRAGLTRKYIFGASQQNYIHLARPDRNSLTSDTEMFALLRDQVNRHPELARGGPSFGWVNAFLHEFGQVATAPPPVPTLVLRGTMERVVDPDIIDRICRNWPETEVGLVNEARHELMMELPAIRRLVFDRVAGHFRRYS